MEALVLAGTLELAVRQEQADHLELLAALGAAEQAVLREH